MSDSAFDGDGDHRQKSKSKVSSKTKKPSSSSYSRKGRRRDEESPPSSPSRRENRRPDDDADEPLSLELVSPTSLKQGQEAMHHGKPLDWNFKVAMTAEKVPDPAIYTCETCNLPILIYGRLIPCKHVFCFDCARNNTEKVCPRCKESFTRVERSALGTVFVCVFGGGKQTPKGCKRTYLSQRDLQAHHSHRHKVKASAPVTSTSVQDVKPVTQHGNAPNRPASSASSASLPPEIDLANLSNISDAQLKAAADILAATMNAGKAGPPPQVDASAQGHRYVNEMTGPPSGQGGYPPRSNYHQPPPIAPPIMTVQPHGQPPHVPPQGPPPGYAYPPQSTYQPQPGMPIGGAQPMYYQGAPPSGPPPSNYYRK